MMAAAATVRAAAEAGGLASTLLRLVYAPFQKYNSLLERQPLTTKSLTSGVMYAAGDALAQVGENYHANKDKPAAEKTPLKWNWTRLAIFGVYGTFIGGPLYHYWFGYLDKLPLAMYSLRQHRHRTEILRAYSTLRRAGIDVNLSVEALPQVKPFHKYTEKAMKIAADQLVFSSLYTLLFFVSVGMMTGAVEKHTADTKRQGMEEYEALLKKRYAAAAAAEAAEAEAKARAGGGAAAGASQGEKAALRSDILRLKGLLASLHLAPAASSSSSSSLASAEGGAEGAAGQAAGGNGSGSSSGVSTAGNGAVVGTGPIAGSGGALLSADAQATLDRLLALLHEEEARPELNISWGTIWRRTWQHTKDVYVDTYIADCVVWPPLQLVNFSFIPLRFQVLYVNLANLFWNSFLSFMANKSH